MAENNVPPTDSIVAIAAAEESVETTWFIKVVDQKVVARETIKDFYGNVALAGQSYWKWYFLEKQTTAKGYFYKINEKSIYFKESIVFPFVQFV